MHVYMHAENIQQSHKVTYEAVTGINTIIIQPSFLPEHLVDWFQMTRNQEGYMVFSAPHVHI